MYSKGDLVIYQGPCGCAGIGENGFCDEHWESGPKSDARSGGLVKGPVAYLDHSCDEWIIGGVEQIREMIRDLEQALKEIGKEAR
jgi:hypothetical protein